MNEKDLKSVQVVYFRRASISALTLDEEWNLSAQLMASAARGPMRRASLEEIVAARDEEARRNRRRRLILGLIVTFLFCLA